ncbi:hypothetical protein ACMD2_07370, partial [Ananas comosus]
QISTLILKVDLDCELCYKKIRKVLCKLQDKEKINAISYDEKNKTVTISGPFDPQKLSKKLHCKAGKVIKEIQIKDNKEKEKEKGKEAEKDKPKDKPAEKEKDKAKDKPAEKEKPKETKPAKEDKSKDKPTESAEQKPAEKDQPSKESQGPPKSEPGPPIQAWPAGPPACCYRPFYEGYYGGCRCYTCGRAYGWTGPGPMGFYGGGPYDGSKSYQFFCEEDPSSSSCRVM